MVEALTIIAGIKQFGLAPDGSDLRDLEAVLADLERQIAELRAKVDVQRQSKEYAQRCCEKAEAENARLRALPLKDEVERVLREAECTSSDGTMTIAPTRNVVEALSRLRAGEQEGWRSIGSAPKDGTEILLHGRIYPPSIDAGKVSTVIGYWTDINGGGWVWYGALSTIWTHWMPLPAAPSEQGGDRDANR